MNRRPLCTLLLGALASSTGCFGAGLLTDSTSISMGNIANGVLRRGARLPVEGEGYVIPELWRQRQTNYATDELVSALERAAARVVREYPGALLGIADLSQKGGGDSVLHRSHENGRDADLIYYATDAGGDPVAPADSMPRYNKDDLRARPPLPPEHGVVFGPFSTRYFDVARNWALVRALLESPEIEIQYLFCNERLRASMLQHAREHGEDAALIERAEVLLHQPGDSMPHDDHLHVRIFCSAGDRAFGCNDRGPIRWWKKRYKYMPPADAPFKLDELAGAIADSVPLLGGSLFHR